MSHLTFWDCDTRQRRNENGSSTNSCSSKRSRSQRLGGYQTCEDWARSQKELIERPSERRRFSLCSTIAASLFLYSHGLQVWDIFWFELDCISAVEEVVGHPATTHNQAIDSHTNKRRLSHRDPIGAWTDTFILTAPQAYIARWLGITRVDQTTKEW